MKSLKLAVDFDQTIHDSQHPAPRKRMGAPLAGAVEAMQVLFDDGHQLIIFTARATGPKQIEAVENWLGYFGIPYHEITNIKPFDCDFIIDDRALRFTDWKQTMRALGYGKLRGFQEHLGVLLCR